MNPGTEAELADLRAFLAAPLPKDPQERMQVQFRRGDARIRKRHLEALIQGMEAPPANSSATGSSAENPPRSALAETSGSGPSPGFKPGEGIACDEFDAPLQYAGCAWRVIERAGQRIRYAHDAGTYLEVRRVEFDGINGHETWFEAWRRWLKHGDWFERPLHPLHAFETAREAMEALVADHRAWAAQQLQRRAP